MSDSPGTEYAEPLDELTAEDLESEALRQEREWYLSTEGFLDFARDSGAAPDCQYQPHGKYAKSILEWNGDPDPDAPDRIIYKYKMVLWPRGTFKSTVFDIAHVAWLIAQNPNIRILVTSETGKQARKFVNAAMQIIDSEWFKERFGIHRGKKWKEGGAEFTSALRTSRHLKEPTLIAAGVGEVWTGAHWDVVIMDDVIGKENSRTITMLEAAWEWFGEVLAQLDPGCKLLVIGTLWHHADIYCKLMNDPDRAALFEMSIHAWRDDHDQLFFPGRLTPTYVENQRRFMSPRMHSCFYENKPFSDEDQLFKPEYFQVIEDHEIPSAVWTYILTDFAFVTDEQKKGRPDFTCFWVVSLDCNRVAYVRDFYVGRWKLDDSCRLLCSLWNDGMQSGWNMRGVTIEKTTHEEAIKAVLRLLKRETFIDPKIIPIGGRSQEIKEIRIEASEPRWRRLEMYFARSLRQQFNNKWKPLFRGMTQWPLVDRDDVADAQSDLDQKDQKDKFYCPAPPAGWRAPTAARHHPSTVSGRYNPEYGYPAEAMSRMAQRQEGQADLWLGRSSSTGSTSDPRYPADHPVNRQGRSATDLFRAPQSPANSIFHKRSRQQSQPDRLW